MKSNTFRLASVAPLLAGLALNPVMHASSVAAIYSLSVRPAAASAPLRMNASSLLASMRNALGEMALSYSNANGDSRRRSGATVLIAITTATKSVQRLDFALSSHDPARISKATKALTKAAADLQTRYSLSSAKCDAATKALRRFNAAWAEYSTRFILAKQKGYSAGSASEVKALRKKVAELSKRMQRLENDVADNAALRGEVVRMRRELVLVEQAPVADYGFQRLSFTLTMVSGSLAAFAITTRDYYPRYYVSVSDYDRVGWINDYWDGYYDGYYRGVSDSYYNEPIIISNPIVAENITEINQNISYETIYNVTNETTNIYQSMPAEDLSNVVVDPVEPGVDFTVTQLSTVNSFEKSDVQELEPLKPDVPELPPAVEPTIEDLQQEPNEPQKDSFQERTQSDSGRENRDDYIPSYEQHNSRENAPADNDEASGQDTPAEEVMPPPGSDAGEMTPDSGAENSDEPGEHRFLKQPQ
ncbi:hypothetical protein ACSV5K_24840 [Agrobacterium pusense]|uniref:hypothetical protein n=1 Tax=Agrobacterium pusense TaxID=648995 RepID=UPI003FCEF602